MFKSIESVIMLILLSLALIPVSIKAVQYLLMPYVVFFHKSLQIILFLYPPAPLKAL